MEGQQQIIDKTVAYVRQELAEAEGGHDWWHIYRVWKQAKHISKSENVNMLVVELGALLHDIADSKFNGGDEEVGPAKAVAFMRSLGLPEEVITHVENIVRYISFKGGHNENGFYSPELGVVQDADRLDAIGAIGIARAFNYGGFKNRALYDPEIAPVLNRSKEDYKHNTAPTINHFYEKLLLLKDKMNTATGKQLAQQRHAFMEQYLDQFYAEFEGDR
ncbi:HD domain-containing protein [Chitinophaga sp. Cy-1792]|uniref:HD domain-containing protein n=1 Tax=Chitinophaga sp. Cy-1792 TaxID=2608339 RepID=UPI00141ED110|nr:HD domain-containing protein [Chitinophaga sp. Cy-1792]NIG53451.1 HD domain-containing protein [Chitinophaga sp. Cy-1792]